MKRTFCDNCGNAVPVSCGIVEVITVSVESERGNADYVIQRPAGMSQLDLCEACRLVILRRIASVLQEKYLGVDFWKSLIGNLKPAEGQTHWVVKGVGRFGLEGNFIESHDNSGDEVFDEEVDMNYHGRSIYRVRTEGIAPKTATEKRECPSCEVELSLYCSHCQQEFEQ